MAVRPTDPEALHLYQLIGAPLLAVIQAEAQAAQVSADFISHIGFEPSSAAEPEGTAAPPGAGTSTALAAPAKPKMLQDGGNIGALRVAEFRVDRVGRDGKPIPYVARVPVLSLFPIPLMQVKHADFDFDIRVVTRVPLDNSRLEPQAQTTQQPVQQGQPPGKKDPIQQGALADPTRNSPDYLDVNRVELKGFLANTRGGAGGQAVTDASIKVRVRMEQSDLPAGLIQLLKMMDESVSLVPQPQANDDEKPVP
jgi:hypothetical protein